MPKRTAASYDPVERRIRAAMTLAGLDFKELAERIGQRALGESTLRRLNAQSSLTSFHYTAIAEACEVSPSFFTIDFNRLPELEQPAESTSDDRLDEVFDRLEALEVRFRASGLADRTQPREELPAGADAQGGTPQ